MTREDLRYVCLVMILCGFAMAALGVLELVGGDPHPTQDLLILAIGGGATSAAVWGLATARTLPSRYER